MTKATPAAAAISRAHFGMGGEAKRPRVTHFCAWQQRREGGPLVRARVQGRAHQSWLAAQAKSPHYGARSIEKKRAEGRRNDMRHLQSPSTFVLGPAPRATSPSAKSLSAKPPRAKPCGATTSAAVAAGLACVVLVASPSDLRAADVTYERLLNPEPQNWLMNHHDFAAQRFSPLATINKSNVKSMKLLFSVAVGGTAGNEALEATPLVDDGFMYISDHWGAGYKIDVRSGTQGRIVWKMDPGQQKPDRHRGVALWGNLVISVTSYDGRVIATDKETGQVVWDKNLRDQPDLELTAAPLALKDSVLIGASGGDRGLRDWIASLDAKTGDLRWKTYTIPAPGEPGSETWKDKTNAWQTGGGAFYVTGSYDPASNLTYWGTGNPVPGYDAARRPGDNLYTASVLALDAGSGKMNWYFQYTPNDNRDYDETGTHILIDTKVNGEDRKLVTHAGRNGFEYMFDRGNGQFLKAGQYAKEVTWTKGIDPKTGKPIEYDAGKDVQVYAEGANVNDDKVTRNVCPDNAGGTNYWPASYSQKTKMVYIP